MKLYVDDGLSEDQFFLAVPVREDLVLGFENSIRGKRVILQTLVEHDPLPAGDPVHGEWDMILVEDGKVTGRSHVRWIDQGPYDWYNDCTWHTEQVQELDDSLCTMLLAYARMIRHHEKDLGRFTMQMRQMEIVLGTLVRKYGSEKTAQAKG